MIGMLRKGQTGNQILKILDVLVPQDEMNTESQELEVAAA